MIFMIFAVLEISVLDLKRVLIPDGMTLVMISKCYCPGNHASIKDNVILFKMFGRRIGN